MAYLLQKNSNGSSANQWPLTEQPLRMGRSHSMDAVVADPAVSRHHFTIEHRHGAHVLVDHQSTNGTRVNGERVTEIRLLPNDRIAAGKTKFLFMGGL